MNAVLSSESGASPRRRAVGPVAGGAALLVFAATVAWLSYAAGYGYDALEYLTIGRSLTDGFAFYDLIPSKGFGIYAVTAGLIELGLPLGHVSLAIVIGLIAASAVCVCFGVTRRVTRTGATAGIHDAHGDYDCAAGNRVALAAAAVVALCCAFMEMTYYQPTAFVLIGGYIAYALALAGLGQLTPPRQPSTQTTDGSDDAKACDAFAPPAIAERKKGVINRPGFDFFLAGLALAGAFHFKSVAAFYGLGLAIFLTVRLRRSPRALLLAGGALAGGVAVGVGAALAYFALTGRGGAFWLWTVKFPLFGYPANTVYLSKLYTKLLWFHGLLVLAAGLSLTGRGRGVWREAYFQLAAVMGAVSYLALLKTQASHYCFPGAGFFAINIAAVLGRMGWLGPGMPRRSGNAPGPGNAPGSGETLRAGTPAVRTEGHRGVYFAAAVVAIGVAGVVSALAYSPRLARRFVRLPDYTAERRVADFAAAHARPTDRVLFIDRGRWLYWITDRYPAVGWEELHVQTTYALRQNPHLLLDALDNPAVTLIEFNPANPAPLEDYFNASAYHDLFEAFETKLRRKFKIIPGPNVAIEPYDQMVFWVRQ